MSTTHDDKQKVTFAQGGDEGSKDIGDKIMEHTEVDHSSSKGEEVYDNSIDEQNMEAGGNKFGELRIKIDPSQDGKASEIRLCSVERPHMRAFHYAWWCYHVAFLMWYVLRNRSIV